MSDEKQELERESILLRILWMVIFTIVWQLAEIILGGVVLLQLGYRLFCRLRPHLDWLPHPEAGQRCKDKTCSSRTQP